MKGITRTLRHLLALAGLLALAACGGGSNVNTVEVKGTVTGLTTGDLSLTNGLSTVNILKGATEFIFPTRMNIGLNYNVSVLAQPAGYTCMVANGYGIAGYNDSTAVAVTCAKNNKLGGSVFGLTADGLVLANGSSTVKVAAGASTFTFAETVMTGSTYGVTILSHPNGQRCVVGNGAGTMGNGDVTGVTVSCI